MSRQSVAAFTLVAGAVPLLRDDIGTVQALLLRVDPRAPVILVSACWQGGVRLGMYDVDREIRAIENIIPGDDMTPETALVKLMWVLGRDRTIDRVKARMRKPVAGELTPGG